MFAQPAHAQAKVPLVLHHIIARIDTTTWNDIVNSTFVSEQLAATQAPRADGVDGGALIRLFGKFNFVQLTPPMGEKFREGDVGIVLSSERPGGLELLRRQGRLVPPGE